MFGKTKGNYFDLVGSFDPRVIATSASKGTIFRYVPGSGLSELLVKQDDGQTVNWASTSTDNQAFVYYVTPGTGNLPTIQSAIDQAFADGSGPVSGQNATIFIPPGNYVENLTFRPGQTLIAQASLTSIGAVSIVGQHVYNPPANTNPLSVALVLQGLSFVDLNNGDTISLTGTEGNFFTVNGCSFVKNSATGSSINVSNPSGIFVAVGTSSTANNSIDTFIKSAAAVAVTQNCSHASGGAAPMYDYTGSGTLNFTNNQCLGVAPYVLNVASGTCYCLFNFLGAFAPNNDCIRIAAGVTFYLAHTTLISSTGTGYVLQGSGTVNGANIVYGDSTAKDPALTFNLLPSDPS